MSSSIGPAPLPRQPFKWLLLIVLFAGGVWYLSYDLVYVVTRDRTNEPPWRNVLLLVHVVGAVPLLLLPPAQFSRRVRRRWPIWHRRAGTWYLASAIVAALAAMVLGPTFEGAGRRVPLMLFATLWLCFSLAAWWCARRGAFAAHERFVARSYAIALAFVFVRVLGDVQEPLFAFLPDQEGRGVTREWLSFVLSLLTVEAGYSWWPAIRAARRTSGSAPASRVMSTHPNA